MTIDELRKKKQEQGYTYEQISEWTGIDSELVQGIFEGSEVPPRYDILQELEKVFETGRCDIVKEPMLAYQIRPQKMQGQYTVEDYLAWPEEERIELIDGVIYGMGAPTGIHQLITGKLYTIFLNYIDKNKGDCIPVISPIDVQLDRDNKTMVQPDIIILCNKNIFKNGRVYGAPDLVVEVLSPSSRKKDAVIKLRKYADAGVREYWIIDPKKKQITVYDFEQEGASIVYSFKDKIPVRIFDNKCEVDFANIYNYISFLL